MNGNPIRMIDLKEMLEHLEKMSTTTVASSDIGRVLQLMKAAKRGTGELLKAADLQMPETALLE
jgi:hypothetical protein